MKLMFDGRVAANLDVRFSCMSLDVLEAEAVEPDLLPPGVRIPMLAGSRMHFKSIIGDWLRDRKIPDYRKGLDEMMIRAYELDAWRMGRMYKTQHTAAVLSYFVSGTDRYYLTPEKTESICYALEAHDFPTLYVLPPCTKGMAEAIRRKRTAELAGRHWVPGIWHLASPDFTVPSVCPSWWEWKEGRKYLVQEPDQKSLEVYRHVIRPRFPSMEDAGVVQFDLSMVDDAVLWLSNLVPYLVHGRDIWEQAADLLQGVPGSRDVLGVLQECEQASERCGRIVAWNEMGISCGMNRAKPLVIL